MDKITDLRTSLDLNPSLGSHFNGKFSDGKKDGFGDFRYQNGDFYRGKFE